jgi:hypothetical protein
MFYECEVDVGTEGNSNCRFKVWVNGAIVCRWENEPYLTAASPDLPTWFLTPINGLDNAPPVTVNMDCVYWDESNARLILTDNEVFADSTPGKMDIQPIISLSDTEIETQKKTPGFTNGETAHAHFWKDDGTYQYLGTKVV